MRAMTRDPTAAARARKAEARADGVISIQLGAGGNGSSGAAGGAGGAGASGGAGGGGFKKGGFKKSGFKSAFAPVGGGNGDEPRTSEATVQEDGEDKKIKSAALLGISAENIESDTEDEGYEVYDPRYPTD